MAGFLSRQKDNLYLCVSLLALTPVFTFDSLTLMTEVSFHKNTTNRKGDKLIHDAQTWRHPTTTNHGSQTREEEEER